MSVPGGGGDGEERQAVQHQHASLFDFKDPPEIQRRQLCNTHGETLVGILHHTGRPEIVVLCHGFQSSKERQPMANIAATLGKRGISAFRFDFAGNGESEGSFQYGNYRREAEDLRAVVLYLRGQNHVISAIVGHSKGGNVVLLYASKYNDVPLIVNICGRFDLERGIEERLGKDFLQRIKQQGFIDVYNRRGKFEYRVTEESLMDRLATNTLASCQLIHKDCRVLTVHGSMDETVPVVDAFEFANYIPNHRLHIIEGADHEYVSHQNDLVAIVVNFIVEELNLHGKISYRTKDNNSIRSRC